MPVFRHRVHLSHPPETVFRWHARPGAFGRLTPPWLQVRVLSGDPELRVGERLHLRVGRSPLSFGWTLAITEVQEGSLFRDEQLDGPFGSWNHLHRFVPRGEGACVLEDEIRWEPPLGRWGGAWPTRRVERELERIFAFRGRRLAGDLDRLAAHDSEPLTIAITGASGLLGSALSDFLRAGGHRVLPLVRSRQAVAGGGVYWSVSRGEIDAEALEGVDAVVHLAGEPLFAFRWTGSKKEAILESRRRGTRLLAEALAGLERGPRVLVSASGSHFYGDRGDEVLTEESAPGDGFLARVCRAWEEAADPARAAGIRVVHLRTSLVLTPSGGALPLMLLPFRLGLGGRIGDGRQRWSWIDADDEVGLVHHAIHQEDLEGPVNASAPDALTNAEFTRTLGRVLGRPTPLPVAAALVELALGEMGRELLLQGQRVRPERALASGFRFLHGNLEDSLRHQLGRTHSLDPNDDDEERNVRGAEP